MKNIKNLLITALIVAILLTLFDNFNQRKKVQKLTASNEELNKQNSKTYAEYQDNVKELEKELKEKERTIAGGRERAEGMQSTLDRFRRSKEREIASYKANNEQLRSRSLSLGAQLRQAEKDAEMIQEIQDAYSSVMLTIDAQADAIENLKMQLKLKDDLIVDLRGSLTKKDQIIDGLSKVRCRVTWLDCISFGPGFSVVGEDVKASWLVVNLDLIDLFKKIFGR